MDYESDTERPTVETTGEDLCVFAKEAWRNIKLFDLSDVRPEFQVGDTDNHLATFHFDYPSRTCGITLTDNNLPEDKTRNGCILDSAQHEVIEGMLLGPLITLAEARSFDEEELESVTHAAVYKIQGLIRKYEDRIKKLKAEVRWLKGA